MERRLGQRTGNSKQSEVRSDIQVGEERNRGQISAGIVRLRRMKDLEAQGEQENSKCEEEVVVHIVNAPELSLQCAEKAWNHKF